jgi:hypothetical protein
MVAVQGIGAEGLETLRARGALMFFGSNAKNSH